MDILVMIILWWIVGIIITSIGVVIFVDGNGRSRFNNDDYFLVFVIMWPLFYIKHLIVSIQWLIKNTYKYLKEK